MNSATRQQPGWVVKCVEWEKEEKNQILKFIFGLIIISILNFCFMFKNGP